MIGKSRGSTARCALSIIDNDHAHVVGGVDRPILKNFVLLPSPPPITRAWLLSMIDNDHARVVGGGCLLSTVVSIVLHYYGLGQLAVQHNKTTSEAPGGAVWKFFFQSWSQRPPRARCQGWGWPG